MKIAFSKFNLKKLNEVKTIQFNDLDIEVKQYLPIEDKLRLVSNAITFSADGNNFVNPIKLDTYTMLEIIFYYTNITFTDKQKEDPAKLYDLMKENGLVDAIIEAIPEEELSDVYDGAFDCAKELYAQVNSIKNVLESVMEDYNATDMDASKIQEKLADPKNVAFLRDVLTKMG